MSSFNIIFAVLAIDINTLTLTNFKLLYELLVCIYKECIFYSSNSI